MSWPRAPPLLFLSQAHHALPTRALSFWPHGLVPSFTMSCAMISYKHALLRQIFSPPHPDHNPSYTRFILFHLTRPTLEAKKSITL